MRAQPIRSGTIRFLASRNENHGHGEKVNVDRGRKRNDDEADRKQRLGPLDADGRG
jgi:hypothetical protein